MLLLWLHTAFAACGDDAMDNAAFGATLDEAWRIYADEAERERYRALMFDAETAVACLPEPLAVDAAARFHRNRALASKLTGDPDGAVASAAAAFRLDPDRAPEWASEVPDFGALLDGAPPAGPVVEFPTTLAARVYTDGQPVAARHTGQPVLVQVFSPEGPPVGGQWIDARARMPDWVAFPEFDCAEPVPVDALVAHVDAAESAYAALDVQTFSRALQDLASGLPCVDQVLRPTEAAAIHRLEGLRLFTAGSRLGALRSFQEAQQLDPAFEPPEGLAREGSTLASLWTRAGTASTPPWVPVDVPEGVQLAVDGIPTAARPATLPGIVQALSPTGRVLWTRYVPGAVPLPDQALSSLQPRADADAEAQLPPALALYRKDQKNQLRSNLGRGLQLGGAALLVSSGLLYGLNAKHVGEYRDPTTPPERLRPLRGAANRAAAGSAGMLLLGGISVGASIVIR